MACSGIALLFFYWKPLEVFLDAYSVKECARQFQRFWFSFVPVTIPGVNTIPEHVNELRFNLLCCTLHCSTLAAGSL
jgi:hypothetical protein